MIRLLPALAGALLVIILGTFGAQAQVNKTWVSGLGTDTGTCAITAPCRTFAYAIGITNAGGEVDVRDSGNYGQIVVAKAISIVAEGVLASISVPSGGAGVLVAAGASDTIVLRGLAIDGHGFGSIGVSVSGGARVVLENCTIRNFVSYGMLIQPPAAATVLVADTHVTNTGGGTGIQIVPGTGAAVTLSLSRLSVSGTHIGVYSSGSTAALTDSILSLNDIGVLADTGGILYLGQNRISGNVFQGVYVAPNGLVYSYGDNKIDANGQNVSGALTPATGR